MNDTARPNLVHLILPHPDRPAVWLQSGEAGQSLPHLMMPAGRWAAEAGDVETRLEPELGLGARVLTLWHSWDDAGLEQGTSLFLLENQDPAPKLDGRWFDAQEFAGLQLANPSHRAPLERYLTEITTGSVPSSRPPWARPGWYALARAWVEGQLAEFDRAAPISPDGLSHRLNGPLETVRNWPLSIVLRAPTAAGPVYFKTSAALPLFVNEARVTSELARLFPGQVPRPLAFDAERNWLLLPHLEGLLDWGASLSERLAMVEAFMRLQLRSVDMSAELLASGCLDRRLERLAEQIEPLFAHPLTVELLEEGEIARLRSLIPPLQELCFQLAEYHLPYPTLLHGDLNLTNVARVNGRHVFFDWTDASLGHPFFDLVDYFFEKDPAVRKSLRDGYLGLWTAYEPLERLHEAWELVETLGPLHHAVSYLHILANLEPAGRHKLIWALPFWLRQVLSTL